MNKKLLIYLSDGVGCRNFIYSSFVTHAVDHGFEVLILKNVPFNFDDRGCRIIDWPDFPVPTYVDMLKGIKVNAEQDFYARKFNNSIYKKYNFDKPPKNWKELVKRIYKKYQLSKARTEEGIIAVENKMYKAAINSPLCNALTAILEKEKPAAVMFTNQRSVTNIPLVLAAEKAGIPSITNIFSWDNLPKGSKIHKSDFFFVWSQYMFDEMLRYYPRTDPKTIRITGTPQFSSYHDHSDLTPRAEFFHRYGLDPDYRYICFSGDDFTSSPHDEVYLDDLCKNVNEYNARHKTNFRVIFRRCPVDHTKRYDAVLNTHTNIATAIDPLWEKGANDGWQSSYPKLEDNLLLKDVLFHSELVVNLGSTVAIDASFLGTPACYVNYQPVESEWDIKYNYKKIHFDTYAGLNPVFWINKLSDYQDVLMHIDKNDYLNILDQAHLWAQRIILHPIDQVHKRIWLQIEDILENWQKK